MGRLPKKPKTPKDLKDLPANSWARKQKMSSLCIPNIPRSVGRQFKFPTLESLVEAIDGYFQGCLNEDGEFKQHLTMTGLALALGVTRRTLLNYENLPEYTTVVERARLVVEHYAELKLLDGGNAAGAIFALKNFGWSDRVDTNITSTATSNITIHFVKSKEDLKKISAKISSGVTSDALDKSAYDRPEDRMLIDG